MDELELAALRVIEMVEREADRSENFEASDLIDEVARVFYTKPPSKPSENESEGHTVNTQTAVVWFPSKD